MNKHIAGCCQTREIYGSTILSCTVFEIYNLSDNVQLCASSSYPCQMCLNEHDSLRRFYHQNVCFHCQCVRNNVMDFSGSLSGGRFTSGIYMYKWNCLSLLFLSFFLFSVMDFSGSLSAGRFTCTNGIVYRFDLFLSFFFNVMDFSGSLSAGRFTCINELFIASISVFLSFSR